MDRFAAMVILCGVIVSMVLVLLALFSVAPIICSCLVSLLYSVYLFMAYEESGVHDAQEFENQFWTIFAVLLCAALVFCRDSPLAFGTWSPVAGLVSVACAGYAMHLWDRHTHRVAMSQTSRHLRRRKQHGSSALLQLQDMGIQVSSQLERIHALLTQIDQVLIPSTINNLINLRYVQSKEREIIQIFEDCDARALNYLLSHVKLGLLFYKIKDHRNFNGKNRTDLINLLSVERLQILTVVSRVILLHSLQLLKLRANGRAEYWVQNILLQTHQDDLSELKTLMDAKGDYFSMNKLVFEDIRSESVRQTILSHFRKEAAVQETYRQMGQGGRSWRNRRHFQMRKVLSDVDDTLFSSGGMYPAGIDKRYARKTVYPGVLAFYRELDLGTQGPEEWEDDQVGNLVFLSARPHVYRDISEKHSIAKFELLQENTVDGRKGMHTMPSLMAGDLQSGSQYVMTNDFEPLAQKKVENFTRYVSIYPEYTHLFVCDNGQGDVRSAEIMFEKYPYEFEGAYVHVVQDITKTYGYAPDNWRRKDFRPFFFRTYVEAALHAASRSPPLIRLKGLRRICLDSVKDFYQIKEAKFPSDMARHFRRSEINLALRRANAYLIEQNESPVEYILAEQRWNVHDLVRTPYGNARIRSFDPVHNLYTVDLDWRPLDVQVLSYATAAKSPPASQPRGTQALETVQELDDEVGVSPDMRENTTGEASESAAMEIRRQEGGESSAEGDDRRSVLQVEVSTAAEPDDLEPLVREEEKDSVNDFNATVLSNEALAIGPVDDDIRKPPDYIALGPGFVTAVVCGSLIKPSSPPVLPIVDKKKSSSIFPFLTKSPQANQFALKPGDQVSTAYGNALVVERREKLGIVVVDMVGWKAKGYLKEETIKKSQKKRIFDSFLRQLSGDGGPPRTLEFPYAHGTVITTPFGVAEVERPISFQRIDPQFPSKPPTTSRHATLGLKLTSWKLANESHVKIYCTVESARAWKDQADGSSLFSKFNTLVSSSRTLLGPFLAQRKPQREEPKVIDQFYKDSAAVCTKFGPGRVVNFREQDGMYEVSLSEWNLANGKNARMFLMQDDLTHQTAPGCQEGSAVLTKMGMSGNLASIDPTTGVHIVTIQATKMVCYLQPESIQMPLKAAVGEEVLTQYGEGKVVRFCPSSNIYTVKLLWNAVLYVSGEKFDRVGDGTQIRDGSLGVDWIFRLFFGTETTAGGRSRSESVGSAAPSCRSAQ